MMGMRDVLRLTFACALATAVGCGGGDGDPLEGEWLHDLAPSTGKQCAMVMVFDGGDVASLFACALVSGGIGAEVTEGTYDIEGSRVSLSSFRGSCPGGSRETSFFNYAVSSSSLTLSDSNGAVLFARVDPSSGSSSGAAFTYGCWEN